MKKILCLTAICSLLCLVSCIDLTDELTVNADGSGSLKLSLDMGMIAGAMGPGNTQIDLSFLDKVKEVADSAQTRLKDAKGISKVQSENKQGYYMVSFDFDRSSNLNKALYKLFGQSKKSLFPALMKVSKHKVKKTNLAPYLKKALEKQKSKTYNEMVFSYINLVSIVHLPADLKKATNIKTKTNGTRNVTTVFTLKEMMESKFDFGNIITF
jgi:hypothetical protein